MLINKTTSDALLVDSLVVLDSNGKPIKNVTEFDTDTRSASLSVGGPVTATSFCFVTSEGDRDALIALLSSDLQFLVSIGKKFSPKKAMDDTASPDDFLVINTFRHPLRPVVAQCTNCSTRFLVHIDQDDNLWDANKINPTDAFNTLTQVSASGLTCDNCSESVELLDENPW